MCRSKEAWEQFVFIPPARPPRRIARALAHNAFFQTAGAASSDARYHLLRHDANVSAIAYAHASAASAPVLSDGMKLHMAMMPATPAPAPRNDEFDRQQPAGRGQGEDSLLEAILPGFDCDTFIWRVSVLQAVEYAGSVLIGSIHGMPKLCSLYLLGASWGPAIAGGAVWRLIMPMMLHANMLHLFFNIFFQLRIGFSMEKQFGRRKFCLLYLFCGFLGNLLSVMAEPMKLAVGASTSGFGLLGVWLAEVLLSWELLGSDSQPRVLFWLAFMVASCVMMSTISPNVDFIGHFGGAFAGFLMAVILADMRDEHQPSWYHAAKRVAKWTASLLISFGLLKVITFGPPGPVPFCGTIFRPVLLPF